MRDAAGQTANGFHFLRLSELQLQSAGFSNVFHKDLEAVSIFAVRNRPSGNACHDRGPILTHALRGQIVEFFSCVKIIGSLKPLLGVGVQASQMPAPESGGAVIAKHSHQRGVCILQNSKRVAAADAIWRIHHQRAKVTLGAPQVLLRGAQRGIEPADQQRHSREERKVRHRLVILAGSLVTSERIVGADRERKRSGRESRLPASIPGAHHHGDREHDEPAFRDIGEI